ncbi:MAG: prepilin-type N-terminal cleavage/methylation domain-containing protein [Defluviitaleaceae bacterium]|nr:prepilin-type N-terminal cleavage/methylation domain-containing protein [Defluviitaleaceae bacterium]
MKRRIRAGFTLTEIIIVLVIISILAAASIPAVLSFIESGRQMNRMNVARTIYLAAQNHLTEMRVTGQLVGFVAGAGLIEIDEVGEIKRDIDNNVIPVSGTHVLTQLNNVLPEGLHPDEKLKYVSYISLPAGYASTDNPSANAVLELLSPVLTYQEVLNDAILIEFNVRTGAVLSVFYSDRFVENEAFTYGTPAPRTDNNNLVSGRRGMGYADNEARNRRQGFYGVGETGNPDIVINHELEVSLHDGYDSEFLGNLYGQNVFFARIRIPQNDLTNGNNSFTVTVSTTAGAKPVSLDFTISIIDTNDLSTAILLNNDRLRIEHTDVGISLIWVLDRFVMTNDPLSITNGFTFNYDEIIQVTVVGASAVSTLPSNPRSPFFHTWQNGNGGGTATIASARHLNNIRQANDGDGITGDGITFRQTDNITVLPLFTPIPGFAGTYNGNNHAINNLTVNATVDVGLFAVNNGTITNVVFYNPTIIGTRAGAVAGTNNGEINQVSIKNPNVTGSATSGGVIGNNTGMVDGVFVYFDNDERIILGGLGNVTASVGGIVGSNADTGEINNAIFMSPLEVPHVVPGNPANTGGIVGNNSGSLNNTFFLALAPIHGAGINPIVINPIVGTHSGTENYGTAYFLSGEPVWPEPAPVTDTNGWNIPPSGRSGFNQEAINTPAGQSRGTAMDTAELATNTVLASSLTGWVQRTPMDAATALDVDNPLFPYRFPAWMDNVITQGESGMIPGEPFWPIAVDSVKKAMQFTYFEDYDNDGRGWYNSREHANSLTTNDNRVVTHDGWAVEIKDVDRDGEEYHFRVGSTEFTITRTGTGAAAVWNAVPSLGAPTRFTIEISADEEEDWIRFIIPHIHLNASTGDGMIASTDDDVEAQEYNGRFAPPPPEPNTENIINIRSPRHINNISTTPNGKFMQRLDLNFRTYTPEINLSQGTVVNGVFGGYYDGGSREIIGVRIEPPNGLMLGLFAHVNGEVKNFIIRDMFVHAAGPNVNDIGTVAAVLGDGTISNVGSFDATINVTGAGATGATVNTGGLVGRVINDGEIKQSWSYASISVSGGTGQFNTGGLVGHLQSGTLTESFNAGFFDANEDTRTNGGTGSVLADRGNIGGLVGLNNGAVQHSFNNARVNVINVMVVLNGISRMQVNRGISAAADMGGIAGNNAGTIDYTYSTTFIPEPATHLALRTGGITGTGSEGVSNSYHLAHGSENITTIPIAKTALRDQPDSSTGFGDFVKGPGDDPETEDNTYADHYPYPILGWMVSFFEDVTKDWDWGWENINPIHEPPGANVFYFEQYSDTEVLGLWFAADSPMLQPAVLNRYVIRDGIGIELRPNLLGYAINIKTGTHAEHNFEVNFDVTGNISNDPGLALLTQRGPNNEHRFVIPASILTTVTPGVSNEENITITIELKANPEVGVYEPLPQYSATQWNRLFAPTAVRGIRSARHLYNIGTISTAPGFEYTQAMDISFGAYQTVNLSNLTATVIPELLSNVTYNGNGRHINALTIYAPDTDNIALFGENYGTITGVTIQNSSITGKENTGALVASNHGTITNPTLQVTNVTGTGTTGGIVGTNNGTITNPRVINSGNLTATPMTGGITGTTNVGGITGINNGTITGAQVENTRVNGSGNLVGGIAGTNAADTTIAGAMVTASSVTGMANTGGIAGTNNGRIQDPQVHGNGTISGSGGSTGTGGITGTSNVGGIAGTNTTEATITGQGIVLVRDTRIRGTGNDIGGIAGTNNGTITQVTLQNAYVSSNGNNVGGVAGGNTGSVTFVSVQQRVVGTPGATDNPMINGVNSVGGVVGQNTNGTITDVMVVSPSARPVVNGTNSGGIVGVTSGGAVDRLVYLAVAPRRGTVANPTVHPFAGSGTTGSQILYLSGEIATRPYQRTYNETGAAFHINYNFLTGIHENEGTTIDIRRAQLGQEVVRTGVRPNLSAANWTGWGINTDPVLNANDFAAIINVNDTRFPYANPEGTVVPTWPAWPIVEEDIVPANFTGIVYYEFYTDGTMGVFVRDAEHREILNTLNRDPNAIVIEAGFATNVFHNGNGGIFVSPNGDQFTASNWTNLLGGGNQVNAGSAWKTLIVPGITGSFRIIPMDLIVNYYNNNSINPMSLVYLIFTNNGNIGSNLVQLTGIAINPFFPKEIYLVAANNTGIIIPEFVGTGVNQRRNRPITPTYLPIRTPWQMQQLSRVATPAANFGRDYTFYLELNLDFSRTSSNQHGNIDTNAFTGGANNRNKTGVGTNFVTNTTHFANANRNVISGTFQGIFDGNGRMISNFNLNNTTNNKGIFNIIGDDAIVKNFTLINNAFIGGDNHGSVSYVNHGIIENVAVVSNAATPIGGANSGGIVWRNDGGTIENVLYVARAPGTTIIAPITRENINNGKINNAYFLAGSVPSPFNTAAHNIGTFLTTQQMSDLDLGNQWTTSDLRPTPVVNDENERTMRDIINPTDTNARYPYPYLGIAPPALVHPNRGNPPVATTFPIATFPATVFAYYEEYTNGQIRFHPSVPITGLTLLPLNDDNWVINNSGYAAIVPRPGWYTVRLAEQSEPPGLFGPLNEIRKAQAWPATGPPEFYFIKLDEFLPTGSTLTATEIFINDRPVANGGRFINNLFAKGIFNTADALQSEIVMDISIRRLQQLRNISSLTAVNQTGNKTFILERDIIMPGEGGTLVTGAFNGIFIGTFNGRRNTISNALDNPLSSVVNAVLFGQNNGVISDFNIGSVSGNRSNITVTANNGVTGTITGITMNNATLSRVVGGANVSAIADTNHGTVSNIMLNDVTVTGTNAAGISVTNYGNITNVNIYNSAINGTVTAGAIAATNNGTITQATVINTTVHGSGPIAEQTVGGIASVNRGTIKDVKFISNSEEPPISAANAESAGGIVGKNDGGTIENVLYIARAPGVDIIAPIARENENGGEIENAYFLAGSVPSPFNTKTHNNIGTFLTTQQMSDLEWGGLWTTSELRPTPVVNDVSERTMRDIINPGTNDDDARYPYPYLGTAPPLLVHPNRGTPSLSVTFPIAAFPAAIFAYYEEYEGGGMGFHTNVTVSGLTLLNDTEVISNSGYAAIVPHSGWYTVRLAGQSEPLNQIREAQVWPAVGPPEFYFIKLDEFFPTLPTPHSLTAVEIFINDVSVENENGGRYINNLFAKGIFDSADALQSGNGMDVSIRRFLHMRNISELTAADLTEYKTFILERDIIIPEVNEPIVTGIFNGTFTGTFNTRRSTISNTPENPESSPTHAILFEQNNGTVKDLDIGRVNGSISNITLTADNGDDGTITGITINNAVLSGGENVSAIADTNRGEIYNITLNNVTVTGLESAAGISVTNHGTIKNINIRDSAINGSVTVGAITATNDGTVTHASVVNTTVHGSVPMDAQTERSIGGITGRNYGTVTDVLFTSANTPNFIPVSAAAPDTGTVHIGGIVGYNRPYIMEDSYANPPVAGVLPGEIDRALYLAPAPFAPTPSDPASINPIIGYGTPATDSYFLAGMFIIPSDPTAEPPTDETRVAYNMAPREDINDTGIYRLTTEEFKRRIQNGEFDDWFTDHGWTLPEFTMPMDTFPYPWTSSAPHPTIQPGGEPWWPITLPVPITLADITVYRPWVYAEPSSSTYIEEAETFFPYTGDMFTVGPVVWTVTNTNDDTHVHFRADTPYTATVTLTPMPNFIFDDDIVAKILGIAAKVVTNNDGAITIFYDFDEMDKIVLDINDLKAESVVFNNKPYEVDENDVTLSLAGVHIPYPVDILPDVFISLAGQLKATYYDLSNDPPVELPGPPTDVGEYRVIVSVPDDNYYFTGEISLEFDITPAPIIKAGISIDKPSVFAEPDDDADIAVAETKPNITYTGDLFNIVGVQWEPQHDPFHADTVYTVIITLMANPNFTFEGIEDENALINGEEATIVGNSGDIITIAYIFPSVDMNKIDLDINISMEQNIIYNGNSHIGYIIDTTTLSVSDGQSITIPPDVLAAFVGQLDITYDTNPPSVPLTGPPIDARNYTVTFSVPLDNPFFMGSRSFNFTINPQPLDAPYNVVLAPDGVINFEKGENNDAAGATFTFTLYKDGVLVNGFENVALEGLYMDDIAAEMAGNSDEYTVTVTAHSDDPNYTDYATSIILLGFHIIKEEDEEE